MALRRAGRAPSKASRGGPPRLILRFAVSTGFALALAAAAILLVVRHYDTVQAERGATAQVRVLASSVLRESLRASDFEQPVGEPRRSELDDLFEARVLTAGVLVATLHSADGTVSYSTDHRLMGSKTADVEHLREALAGTVRGDVAMLPAPGIASEQRKVLRTYAPVETTEGIGVVAVMHDYAPIARAAEATFLPVAGIFQGILILLFVGLVPILRRVTVRIRRQVEEIEYRAFHDALTGLPNRVLFRDRIEQMIAGGSAKGGAGAVILLDVDHFREINDALGHETGDVLLQQLADRLAAELGTDDTLARLGGDEFGILLPRASSERAQAVAARVHAALEHAFPVHDLPLDVVASAGIAVFPQHGESPEALLQHADVAMYVAKDSHVRTELYDAERDTSDAARLSLAGELRRAIENRELLVYFQPKADLATASIVGAEALIRWPHAERGFIPPNDFVPVAERTGLIKPLSDYVLAAALAQCAEWNAAGHDLHVAVNLTIPDLLDLELPDHIAALLTATGVRPEQLELEITESTLLSDPFRVRQVLARLREMGLRLGIDDFGTGYSSLAYLRRLPVQTIKIDRSFVMGMVEDASDATIVRSTIDLGRNLGLAVVAEGVETQEVWDALRAQGCSLAQGYFIGCPAPASELAALLGRDGGVTGSGMAAAAST